ncbi:hypothetical protein ACLBSQ_33145, partial [Klebsiella pneumoniae]
TSFGEVSAPVQDTEAIRPPGDKGQVLLAEQHLPFIRRVADRFCVLHRGRNVAEGDIMALDEPLLAQWITPDPAP